MHGAISLQKAIVEKLARNETLKSLQVADRIFDQVPPGAAFPFVTFGTTLCRDWSTSSETGQEHYLTLEIWTRNGGRKTVLEIADAISRCLERGRMHLEGYNLVQLNPSETTVRNVDGIGGYLGTMRYRAVLEPTSEIRRV